MQLTLLYFYMVINVIENMLYDQSIGIQKLSAEKFVNMLWKIYYLTNGRKENLLPLKRNIVVKSLPFWKKNQYIYNCRHSISALRVRMVWKRNIVRLGTRIVIIFNKHAANLHWTLIHIARCVCERCQIMDTYKECLYCQEIASISDKKN